MNPLRPRTESFVVRPRPDELEGPAEILPPAQPVTQMPMGVVGGLTSAAEAARITPLQVPQGLAEAVRAAMADRLRDTFGVPSKVPPGPVLAPPPPLPKPVLDAQDFFRRAAAGRTPEPTPPFFGQQQRDPGFEKAIDRAQKVPVDQIVARMHEIIGQVSKPNSAGYPRFSALEFNMLASRAHAAGIDLSKEFGPDVPVPR